MEWEYYVLGMLVLSNRGTRMGGKGGWKHSIDEAIRLTIINKSFSSNYLYVLVAIGVPANILTVLAILTFKQAPATFFVAVLATCDGCALIFKLVFKVLFKYTPNSIVCKTEFIPILFTIMANWTLVLICVERFISVCFPLKKLYLLTKRRSYAVVALMATGLFVTLATLFCLMREYLEEDKCYVTEEEHRWFWDHIYLKVMGNSIAVYIPFLFIFIFTLGVIIGLKLSSRDRRRLLRSNSSQNTGSTAAVNVNDRQIAEAEKLERAITVMMTFTALYFLVFSLPSCIYYTLPVPPVDHYLAWERHRLFSNIQYLLLDSTHTFNFFLYVLTGKRFRSQLKKVLLCMPLRKHIEKRKSRHNFKASRSTSNTQITHVGQ
ncbi:hypothetical protein Btru_017807 [Bulinus truncatus]|nr:hypothetical protein Btru_017807 [Bulinus truncatus]